MGQRRLSMAGFVNSLVLSIMLERSMLQLTLNPTGHPNSWVEIDLMQEHLNYWIKVSI